MMKDAVPNLSRVLSTSPLRSLLCVLMGVVAIAGSPCQAAAEGKGAARMVVLDTTGFWRHYNVFAPPVIASENGTERLQDLFGLNRFKTERYYLNWETPPAPADWSQPDFDDSAWTRGPALFLNVALAMGSNPYGLEDWDQINGLQPGNCWFVHSHWQSRTEKLFALAGEVAKRVEGSK